MSSVRPTWRIGLLPAFAVAALTCVLLAFEQRQLGADLIERSLVRNQQRADVLGLQLQLALRDAVSQVCLLARSTLLRPDAAPGRAGAAAGPPAVFMIAREALLNALRHADALTITVRLDGDEFQLELSVSDDGRGLQAAAGTDGLGLIGMRERALAIGAELRIDGRVGHGTMVALTWEADEARADEPHLPDR